MPNLEKYTGRTVEIIYIDRDNRITRRKVAVRRVRGGTMEAFCLQRKEPRRFTLDNILAVAVVTGRRTG